MAVTEVRTDEAPAPGPGRAGLPASAWLLMAFLAEGVLGKAILGGTRLMPQSVHLLLTAAASAFLIALAASRRALGCRARRAEAGARALRACVLVMVLWGLVSSVAQLHFMAGNIAFWAVWTAHLLALWWAAPRLLQWAGCQERLRVLGLVLGATLALTVLLLPWGGFVRGRFGGPFANPTIMGRAATLLLLFWFAQVLARGGRDALSAALALSAGVLVALTRTRASVAAAILGMVACLVAAALTAEARARARVTRVAVVSLFCGALLSVSLLTVTDAGKVAGFLRLREGIEDIYSTARAMNWQAGRARLEHVGFFGDGYLSKFAPERTRSFLGIVVPTYDWTTDRDPLNSVLGTCQQTGWIGGGIFVCFLALLVWRSFTADPRVRPFLAALCTAGLVWGLLDGNWLTSFGDPVDRLSLAVFALLLDVPPQPLAMADEGRHSCPI
jgi:hypothetical protein